jgi:glycosyltransferase involved in cell wall biosynthesis
MLSICIPIYNYNVAELVLELRKQALKLNAAIEIICIDDCSEASFKNDNAITCNESGCYIELNKNIGRSKIRNLFLKHAKYQYLLFIDCDSLIISANFLPNYIDIINSEKPKVVCGGRIYPKDKPSKNKLLRWKYGHTKESKPAEVRQSNSNKSFMTNNFLINREIFEKFSFDERLSQYGHEDTLFGYQLKKNNVSILHINNPVLNGELEDNEVFLQKTEKGLENLARILEYTNYDPQLIEDVTILKHYNKLKKSHLLWIVDFLFKITHNTLRTFLEKGFSKLIMFDFYKLGYFSLIERK